MRDRMIVIRYASVFGCVLWGLATSVPAAEPSATPAVIPTVTPTVTPTVSPAAAPTAVPAAPLTPAAPATTRPAAPLDPAAEQILDRLERKGDQVTSIVTDLVYTKTDPVLDSKEIFKGILRFKKDKPNPRFLIRFDKFIQEGVERDKKEWHAFDGEWYIEARERTSTIVRRQIVRPGEEVKVFELGQGPFPLPFGQKKAEIVKHFAVKLVPPDPKDPPNADHLECTPLPGTEMDKKFGKVHFYIDRRLDLPVGLKTVEKAEGAEGVQISAEFPQDKIQINTGLAGSDLNLPDLKGYQVDTVPLPPAEKSENP